MEIVLYTLGIVCFAVGVVGLVAPGLPGGILLALGVVLAAWAEGFTRINGWTVAFAVVVAIVTSAIDYLAAMLGAKLGGGTKWGILGAGLGLVAGLFLGPFGILLGPAAGAVLFEYWKNPDARTALKSGAGVAVGFFAGIVVKLSLAFVLLGVVLFDWWR